MILLPILKLLMKHCGYKIHPSKKVEGFIPFLAGLCKVDKENNDKRIDLTKQFGILHNCFDETKMVEIDFKWQK